MKKEIVDFNFRNFTVGELSFVERAGGILTEIEKSCSEDGSWNGYWNGIIEVKSDYQEELLNALLWLSHGH